MANRRVRITVVAPEIVATMLADDLAMAARAHIIPEGTFPGWMLEVEEALLLGSE